jgi:hypothetical protein
MTFDGTMGKVVTAAAVAIRTPCTVEVWMRTSSAPDRRVLSTGYTGTSEEWALGLDLTGAPIARLYSAGQAQFVNISSTGTLQDGSWHHLIWVCQSTLVQAYTDGVLKGSGVPPWSLVGMTIPCEIGYASDGNFFWSGSLNKIAIYPRALTATQIANLYQSRLV